MHARSVLGTGTLTNTWIAYLGSPAFHPGPQSHSPQYHGLLSVPQAVCPSLPLPPPDVSLVGKASEQTHIILATAVAFRKYNFNHSRFKQNKGVHAKTLVQYLLQGREGTLLLLLQGFDLLEQTASLQTQPPNLLKHLLVFSLKQNKQKTRTTRHKIIKPIIVCLLC